MAAPNIVNVSSILGKTAVANITTSLSSIVTNDTANSVYKINSIIVSNVDGSNTADLSVAFTRSSVPRFIAKTIPVEADTSFTPLDKSTVIYLEENDSLDVSGSANDHLQILISYEVIS